MSTRSLLPGEASGGSMREMEDSLAGFKGLISVRLCLVRCGGWRNASGFVVASRGPCGRSLTIE